MKVGKESAVQVSIEDWKTLLEYLEEMEDRSTVKGNIARLQKGLREIRCACLAGCKRAMVKPVGVCPALDRAGSSLDAREGLQGNIRQRMEKVDQQAYCRLVPPTAGFSILKASAFLKILGIPPPCAWRGGGFYMLSTRGGKVGCGCCGNSGKDGRPFCQYLEDLPEIVSKLK